MGIFKESEKRYATKDLGIIKVVSLNSISGIDVEEVTQINELD